MKKLFKFLFISIFIIPIFFLSGCGDTKDDDGAKVASSQLIPDGQYTLSAAIVNAGGQIAYFPVSGNLTNSYIWLGSGKYREMISGVGTINNEMVDCSTSNIYEITLNENGKMIEYTALQTGCIPAGSLPEYTMNYRIVSGGMQRIMRYTSNGIDYVFTYTYLKL